MRFDWIYIDGAWECFYVGLDEDGLPYPFELMS
jgi:hypothetical protein